MKALDVLNSAICVKLVEQVLVFAEYTAELDGKVSTEFQGELDYTVREFAALLSALQNAAESERQLELQFEEQLNHYNQNVGV